ncbi:hypothetical protein [Roseovarius sp. ZX-A-9]|uniref:hypothetical protein n=1 Tax=Roseovarius sp. ZX-A-9 TaxID=3014783 RepID=UPI00232DFFD0|nr:hypothetical protein [Roseovarius sp. ZX-A-9]
MYSLAKAAIAGCAVFLSLQMAHAGDLPKANRYLSATDQHRAIVDCKYELGSPGWAKMEVVYVAYPWGGDSVFRILPDRNVSAADAAWINECADKKLGRESRPAAATPQQEARGRCPKHAPVLYGGARYCVGN